MGTAVSLINLSTYTFPCSGYLQLEASYRANYYVQCRVYSPDKKNSIKITAGTGTANAQSNQTDTFLVAKGMIMEDVVTNNKQYNKITFYPLN